MDLMECLSCGHKWRQESWTTMTLKCPACGGCLPDVNIKITPIPLYIGDHVRMRYISRFLSPTAMLPKPECLDAGAGQCIYQKLVEERGYIYHGIDIHPDTPPPAIVGDITDIQFPDEYFDAVLCVDVLEDVKDDFDAVLEIFRVLKSGGLALIHVPNKDQKHFLLTDDQLEENPDHIRKGYTMDHFFELINQAGFAKTNIMICNTFTGFDALAWDLGFTLSHKLPVDLNAIADLEFTHMQGLEHYGFIGVAHKQSW